MTNASNITYQEVRLLQTYKCEHSREVHIPANLFEFEMLKQRGLIAREIALNHPGRYYITPLGEQVLERAKQVGLNDYIYGVKFPFP